MKIFLGILLSLLLLFSVSHASFADDTSDCKNGNSDACARASQSANQKIKELEAQLSNLVKQEKTLASQITYMNSQISLTNLRIEESKTKLAQLELDISALGIKIDQLNLSLSSLSEALMKRIVATYKRGKMDEIELFLSSRSFADIITQYKYLQVVQTHDKKLLVQMQATKGNYEDQKGTLETKQQEVVKTKKQLEGYQATLAQQKKDKQELLRITKNDEAVYQAKIRAAQEEQNAILAILGGQGNEVGEGALRNGTTIGIMIYGRSACSSGTHLHFEVHQNNSIQDPNNFLSNVSFAYDDNDGGRDEGAISPHGSWDWPIPQQILITQGFGMTPYAQAGAYNGGPHTGIDMYSSAGLGIKAVRDGTLSRGSIPCGSGTLRYKKIDHGDGATSYYLHVL